MNIKKRRWLKLERIMPDGQPYLDRYVILRLGRLQIYLHQYHQADPKTHFHNHRWFGLFWILKGEYHEQIIKDNCPKGNCSIKHRKRWHFNVIPPNRIHRISYTKPHTLSLGITWKTRNQWYFWQVDKNNQLIQDGIGQ